MKNHKVVYYIFFFLIFLAKVGTVSAEGNGTEYLIKTCQERYNISGIASNDAIVSVNGDTVTIGNNSLTFSNDTNQDYEKFLAYYQNSTQYKIWDNYYNAIGTGNYMHYLSTYDSVVINNEIANYKTCFGTVLLNDAQVSQCITNADNKYQNKRDEIINSNTLCEFDSPLYNSGITYHCVIFLQNALSEYYQEVSDCAKLYTPPLQNNGTNISTDLSGCIIDSSTQEIIDWILNMVRFVGIILVIVLGMLDFIKATASGEQEEVKKSRGKFVKRLIACIALFLAPIIVDFLLWMINSGSTNC